MLERPGSRLTLGRFSNSIPSSKTDSQMLSKANSASRTLYPALASRGHCISPNQIALTPQNTFPVFPGAASRGEQVPTYRFPQIPGQFFHVSKR